MSICELCSYNESFGYFEIEDSHIFSRFKTQMWLCKFCYDDLKNNGVRINRVSFPAEPHDISPKT